ncbi:hypothetical protein HOLleu_02970 [Holothuria leucospilota]|uniref:DUF5641 domain-containing protein n=1 Tax=Holothuria leucospilota TaxID=206669 RepID=A0A9Q1HK15_HOLLE|nr:hypothetical protein HOLleu_02970 [Holothuria leucospilota]
MPTLNQRKRWREKRQDLQVKDMVLLKEKDILRRQWPLGRIIEIYPGPDGHVRVIKVKTSKGEFTRVIPQVYPLEYVGQA